MKMLLLDSLDNAVSNWIKYWIKHATWVKNGRLWFDRLSLDKQACIILVCLTLLLAVGAFACYVMGFADMSNILLAVMLYFVLADIVALFVCFMYSHTIISIIICVVFVLIVRWLNG